MVSILIEEITMGKVVNIGRCFTMFSDTFSPKIIGEMKWSKKYHHVTFLFKISPSRVTKSIL